jgi:asparagine synthase (glutamine-hydrolysing)
MCGIAGIVGGPVDARLLRAMARIQAHRGPDEEGVYRNDRAGLSCTRLKIIDLVTGQMPMTNEDGSCVLVFNGEIYNFKELTAKLESKGHRFRSKSDAETILHLYEEEGDDCLKFLHGMFAFALWDARRRRLLLARDRIGIKPLYYRVANGRITFASELKALLLDATCPREIDLEALRLYLTYLYVPSPLTIFTTIKKLLPGHFLVFENGQETVRQYWDLPRDSPPIQDHGQAVHEAFETLKRCVEDHLVSDVPLGVFLSSGIDSASLVALMSQVHRGPIKTFTLDFQEHSFSEAEGARQIAKQFETDHREFLVHPDVADLLPKLVWHLDEPLADSSLILTYLVASYARHEVTVALSGVGGDELFSGYPRYLGIKLARRYDLLPLSFRREVARFARFIPDSARSDNPSGRIRRFLVGGPLPVHLRYLAWVSFFTPEALAEIFSPRFRSTGVPDLYSRHLAYLERPGARDAGDPYFYLDLKTYLPEDLLMLADKMTMAASLELRVPFCDHRLVETMARISPALRSPGFRLKALLRELMAPLLPREVLQRPKRGFTVPMAAWFKGPLRSLALDLLSEDRIARRGYLDPRQITRVIDHHLKGTRSYLDQIFALMVFELWHQEYMDDWPRRQAAVFREVADDMGGEEPISRLTTGENGWYESRRAGSRRR